MYIMVHSYSRSPVQIRLKRDWKAAEARDERTRPDSMNSFRQLNDPQIPNLEHSYQCSEPRMLGGLA